MDDIRNKSLPKMLNLLRQKVKKRAIPIAKRSTVSTLTNLQQQQLELDKTFKFGHLLQHH